MIGGCLQFNILCFLCSLQRHLDAGHDGLPLLDLGDLEMLARNASSFTAASTGWRTRGSEEQHIEIFYTSDECEQMLLQNVSRNLVRVPNPDGEPDYS